MNLILDKPAVTELIQQELTKNNIKEKLEHILSLDGRNKILNFYTDLENLLNKKGASKETAGKIINYHLELNS